MSIELEWESVSNVFDEYTPLFESHYEEIYKESKTIDRDVFVRLEENKQLYLLTAREDRKPIGYYGVTVLPSIYNNSVLEARDVGIYVLPEYRDQGITTTMQEVMDKLLKERCVKSVFVSYPYDSTIPTEKGYVKSEVVYERRL